MKRSIKALIATIFASMSIGTAIGVGGFSNAKDDAKVTEAYDSRLYIRGINGGWDFSGSLQLQNDGTSNVGARTNITVNSDTQYFRIAYYEYGSFHEDWGTYGGGQMDGKTYTFAVAHDADNNIKIKYAGTYNVYLTSSYKVYISRQLTISFDAGTGGSVSPTSKTVTQEYYGATNQYGDLPTPTRTGYDFDGWYTDPTSGTKVTSASSTYSLTANQTLYAHWTPAVYTITYDRNMSSGLQKTQSKNHGTNVTAYTPGSSPLTDSGWNPSPLKRFVHWNTAYDDSGDTVNAGDTITTNDSFFLYYIEDWYDYRYKVDNGSWVTLVHNDEGKGSGIKVQFAPATAQSLPLHGKLYFQYSANGGSTWTDISSNSITFEGNYDTTEGIELATLDTIYLKITDSNTYTCWVPGISDRTICVFDSSSATTGGTPYTMRGNGNDETVTTLPVYIKKGQFVKRGYAGNYTYGSLFAGGTGNAGSSFRTVGSDTAVECLVTGVYTVYNKRGSYDNWKDIYFTRDEEASASYIAEIFNDIVETVCSGITGGTKSLSDLQAIWGSVSSTKLYKHFNNQFAETKNYFKTSSATTDPEILECVERYDYIVKKYGTTALPDFIGRNNGYTAAPQGAAMVSILSDINKNGSGILIVVIAITATAAAAGGYFFLRRRKED